MRPIARRITASAKKAAENVKREVLSRDSNSIFNVEGYEPLAAELAQAYIQSAVGKGKERHANNKPFDRQPILEIGRIVGPAFDTGQAMKKIGEATQMFQRGNTDMAIHELHGAMNYCAAAIMLMRETQ